MTPPRPLAAIDLLKALASQVIVLHHLSAYGPLSDRAAELAPGIAGWLFGYGRMAVQVFLVVGGFLAAGTLAHRDAAPARPPLRPIARRFLRLAVPYWGALALAIAGAALAGLWMDDPSIPAPPSAGGLLALVLMLQDVLGVDSVLAGAWYLPIDVQLFASTALLLWAGRSATGGKVLVLALAAASLLFFNRDARWDPWALYFFGAYGLGAAAAWSADPRRSPAWLGVLAAVAGLALVLDFRLRIAIALVVAIALGLGHRAGLLQRLPGCRVVTFLGRISFALFLVHFPVLLLANAAYVRLGSDAPAAVAAFLAAAWVGAMSLATAFHRFVEAPATARITDSARPGPSTSRPTTTGTRRPGSGS